MLNISKWGKLEALRNEKKNDKKTTT